ncbi:unnamed protein product [Pleuronectes platessa]|uniref:Uncharacterized protein n=1 Tax=Pleuronectes platessa TaxID=8262 RepID=A0A9N7UV67_PLEPL|nr:unnamed protein product [Pleuronectes platessa]
MWGEQHHRRPPGARDLIAAVRRADVRRLLLQTHNDYTIMEIDRTGGASESLSPVSISRFHSADISGDAVSRPARAQSLLLHLSHRSQGASELPRDHGPFLEMLLNHHNPPRVFAFKVLLEDRRDTMSELRPSHPLRGSDVSSSAEFKCSAALCTSSLPTHLNPIPPVFEALVVLLDPTS